MEHDKPVFYDLHNKILKKLAVYNSTTEYLHEYCQPEVASN